MSGYSEPEHAISVFENLHGVVVTVYDFCDVIAPHLAIRREEHRHGACLLAKSRDRNVTCAAFESFGTERIQHDHPGGWLQRCPAGLGEAVTPIRAPSGTIGMLLAGPFAVGGRMSWRRDGCNRELPRTRLKQMTEAQASDLLECLRQLAARLAMWAEYGSSRGTQGRGAAIMRLINARHATDLGLDEVARELGLSRWHAARVVRASCGATLSELLARARLAHAAALLRFSDLPVLEAAFAAGFRDLGHFHRSFRRRFGMTPAAWRTSGGP